MLFARFSQGAKVDILSKISYNQSNIREIMSERQVWFMENHKEEPMVYLKDLIFTALRRWRAVLAIALIVGILLGGMQAVSGLRAANVPIDPQAYQQAMEQYAQKKAVQELHLQTARENIEQQQAYIEESVLMQLNPYSYYDASVHLYVETERQILPDTDSQKPVDRTADVLHAYEAMLLSGPVVQVLADAMETQSRYVLEVLTVEQDSTANALVLNIKLPTADAAQEILALVENRMDAAGAQINRDVAAHRATITAQSVNEKLDMELPSTQQAAYTRLTELKTALTEIEIENAQLVAPAAQTGSVKDAVKKAVIWAVIGAVLGAFVTMGVLWVAHIGSDKVYAARNLTNRTGIKVIGVLCSRIKNPVDRFVYRLEGREGQVREIGAVATDICCRAKEAKHLLITGSGDKAQRESILKAVTAVMPGVRVEDQGNVLCASEALEALSRCDAVVLVEKTGVSRYDAVRRQISIICDYEKEILGCVLLEE